MRYQKIHGVANVTRKKLPKRCAAKGFATKSTEPRLQVETRRRQIIRRKVWLRRCSLRKRRLGGASYAACAHAWEELRRVHRPTPGKREVGGGGDECGECQLDLNIRTFFGLPAARGFFSSSFVAICAVRSLQRFSLRSFPLWCSGEGGGSTSSNLAVTRPEVI